MANEKGIGIVVFSGLCLLVCFISISDYLDTVDIYDQYCTGVAGLVLELIDGQTCDQVEEAISELALISFFSGFIGFVALIIGIVELTRNKDSKAKTILAPHREISDPFREISDPFVPISQMWGANCPECKAVNMGNITQMEGQITCGGCGFLHSPESLRKMSRP